MVEARPAGCGLFGCGLFWLSLFFSPPSDRSSLPSTMTWAPCPHGVQKNSGLLWTQAKARAHDGYQRACDSCDPRGLFSSKTRGISHVRDRMQPGRPSHIRTNGESIFFCVDSSPFVLAWHFGKPLQSSAVQEGPTSNILAKAGLQAQLGLHSL